MENKPVWESYREYKTRTVWLQEREIMALLIHPLYTPTEVAKEIRKEFDERWETIEKELELHFEKLEQEGKIK